MWQLVSAIGEIVLRRRGPENLPDSTFLCGLLLTVFALLSLIYLAIYGEFNWLGLGDLAAQLVLAFLFVFITLRFFKLERRYRRTMSAILGVNILVHLVYLPLVLGGLALDFDLQGMPFGSIALGFFLWLVVIQTQVFARALSQPLILGFMFAILFEIVKLLPSLISSEYFSPAVD